MMLGRARGLVAAGLCLCPLVSCAWEVAYGPLFTVHGITRRAGRPVLPLSRAKYTNVRVLDKETFSFLQQCQAPCVQTPGEGAVEIVSMRRAKTRSSMWIGEVSVDGRWLLTFLVFARDNGYEVVPPDSVRRLDKTWLKQVKSRLESAVKAEIAGENK